MNPSSIYARGNPPHPLEASMSDYDPLIAAAKHARNNAHAPFSNFKVGAGLRASSGKIYGGCNVENATYGLTVCAERIAIFKALSEGERKFDAIAVVTDTDALTPPCGACRQLIWEFCGDVPVVMTNLKGKVEVVQMRDLFPKPFDSSNFR
jgi:cytidine deaminase